MPKSYNKLVRDKIPDIIRASGSVPITQVLNEETYGIALVDKLREAIAEYSADPDTEELATILEVVFVIAKDRFNLTPAQLEDIRLQKLQERGGFEGRIMLEEVHD